MPDDAIFSSGFGIHSKLRGKDEREKVRAKKLLSPFLFRLFTFTFRLSCAEGIVARNIVQMPRVIKSHNANIVTTADFKTIDAAIRCYEPRCCSRFAVDRAN